MTEDEGKRVGATMYAAYHRHRGARIQLDPAPGESALRIRLPATPGSRRSLYFVCPFCAGEVEIEVFFP